MNALSNLDAKLRGQTRIELQKLHRDLRATMLYVTHDQIEAMTLGDRIVVLRGGDVMQFDTPLMLYNQPANLFVAGFIGTPPMNFLPGKISRTNGSLSFVSTGGTVSMALIGLHEHTLIKHEGRDVVMGIRAEHIGEAIADAGVSVASVASSIEAVEHMGSEVFVYFGLEGTRFVAKLPGYARVVPGQPISLAWDMDNAHFFDTQTEQAIRE